MTNEFACFLKAATEHYGNQEIDMRDDYSGRGMYGRSTAAVVVDNPMQLFADALNYIRDTIEINLETGESNMPVEFDTLRQDSMGRDSVVLY